MDIILKHFLITGILLAAASRPLTSEDETGGPELCKGTQMVEYDTEAIIHCQFPEDFYGVYWYDSHDVGEAPLISLEESQLEGRGYDSGEFSIEEDGSLIIQRVTSHHNHTFSVALLLKRDAHPIVYRIAVIVKDIIEGCNGTQYLEFGRQGIVHCFFIEYYGVFWYNSTDTSQSPLLRYKQSEKTGDGYDSKEFDILRNGSLVINNVTLRHDHMLAVAVMKTRDADVLVFNVSVVVTAHPPVLHPVVNECQDEHPCFLKVGTTIDLSCFVKSIRPAIALSWWSVNRNGKFPIPSEKDFVSEDVVYSIYANVSHHVNTWTLLKCEGSDNASLLKINESLVLLEPLKAHSSNNIFVKQRYIETHINTMLECSIGSNNDFFAVWRKITQENETSQIVLNALGLQTLYNDRYLATSDGHLILNDVNIADEGVYSCISGDGLIAKEVRYNVTIVVFPKAPSPTINECEDYRHCILQVEKKVELTCSILGIKPLVVLEWDVDHEDMIASSEKSIVKKTDGTFDISIKSLFQQKDYIGDVQVVICKAPEDSNQPFRPMHLSTNVTLNFSIVNLENLDTSTVRYTQELGLETHGENSIRWTVIVVIMILLLIISVLIYFIKVATTKSGNSELSSGSTESESLIELEDFAEFEDFRKTIGLDKWIEDGLLCQANVNTRNEDKIIQFFQKLDTSDTEVIKLVKELAQTEASEIRANKGEILEQVMTVGNNATAELSCRDVLFAIIHSCDGNLRKTMLFQIALRNVAVPLILPVPKKSEKAACLLKDFDNISKNLKDGFRSVTTYPFPIMAAVRIGSLGRCSKSGILNTMFGKVQGYPNRTFFYGHQDDNYYSQFTNGTVEAAWFIPNGNTLKEENILNEEMCVLNYRGPLKLVGTTFQEQFVREFASIILILVSGQMLKAAEEKINSYAILKDTHTVVVQTDGRKSNIELNCLQRDNVKLIDVKGRYSETTIAEEICQTLKSKLQDTNVRKTLNDQGRKLCEKLGLNMDYDGTLRSET